MIKFARHTTISRDTDRLKSALQHQAVWKNSFYFMNLDVIIRV